MKNIILGLISVTVITSIVYFAPSRVKENPIASEAKKTSVESLLKMTGSQKCTYSLDVEGIKTSGTVYINNGNMRADSKTFVQGKEIESHVILISETVYAWGAGMAQGVKMNIKGMKEQAMQQPNAAQSFDMTKEMNYSCTPYTYDASYFTPPTTISFMDVSQMMNQKINKVQSGTNTINSACDACNSAPESARAQCRAALRCK